MQRLTRKKHWKDNPDVRLNKVPPNPYEYPSADDYYDAVDEYNDWLKQKEEAEAIAADLAYERSLEEQWRQESTKT